MTLFLCSHVQLRRVNKQPPPLLGPFFPTNFLKCDLASPSASNRNRSHLPPPSFPTSFAATPFLVTRSFHQFFPPNDHLNSCHFETFLICSSRRRFHGLTFVTRGASDFLRPPPQFFSPYSHVSSFGQKSQRLPIYFFPSNRLREGASLFIPHSIYNYSTPPPCKKF